MTKDELLAMSKEERAKLRLVDCAKDQGCSGCSDCSGCSGCSDCLGCSGCSGCQNLRNAQYIAWGIQLTKVEYESL